jgi:hypothetical protein
MMNCVVCGSSAALIQRFPGGGGDSGNYKNFSEGNRPQDRKMNLVSS